MVSWQPPQDGGVVGGYMIGYGEGVPDVNWQYLEAHRRNVTIKNLKSATQYVVSVRAFNDVDKGPVVYDLVFTANTHTPSTSSNSRFVISTPTRLRTRVLSPTSISLHWFDPSLGRSQRIVDNRYYNVHYQVGTQLNPNGKTMSVIVKDLQVVLHDLEPATRYEFKVRTVKGGQTSPYSDAVVSQTLDANAGPTQRYQPIGSETTKHGGQDNINDDDDDDDDDEGEEEDYGEVDFDGADQDDYRVGRRQYDSTATEAANWLQGQGHDLPRVLRKGHHSFGDSGKRKREQAHGELLLQVDTHPQPNTSASADVRPEVVFSTLVLHRISAYITWPAMPQSVTTNDIRCSGGGETENQAINAAAAATDTANLVVGYRLRYHPEDVASEFVARNLSANFVLLENLQANTKYRYQLKYLFNDGSETAWTGDAVFDTSSQH
jgi:hypothetical protein